MITEVEKELIAQQADLMGFPDTARSVRTYLSTELRTYRDLSRTHTFASAFGWKRIPGWRLVVECRLRRLQDAARREA